MMRSNPTLSLSALLLLCTTGTASDDQDTSQPVMAPKPQIMETYLGVFTDSIPVTRLSVTQKNNEQKPGVFVTYVLPSSPAARAGIKPNDILVNFEENRITSPYQLKTLVTHSTPDQPVTIRLERGLNSRSIEVQLAKRRVTWSTSRNTRQQIQGPAIVRLKNRNNTTVFVPRDNMLIPGTELLWRIRPSLALPEKQETTALTNNSLNQAITILTQDGNNFQLKVSRQDDAEHARLYEWEGTEDEIEKQVKTTAPATVATDVRRSLDWAKTQVTLKRGVRFQVQPRLEGANQVVRVLLSCPGHDGSIRLVQIDHAVDNEESPRADALLKIAPIASEIEKLSPVIRDKMESTLRNTPLPCVHVVVERSQ